MTYVVAVCDLFLELVHAGESDGVCCIASIPGSDRSLIGSYEQGTYLVTGSSRRCFREEKCLRMLVLNMHNLGWVVGDARLPLPLPQRIEMLTHIIEP